MGDCTCRSTTAAHKARCPALPPPPDGCPDCWATTGTTRTCAPQRCYCGHEACPAYASYVDLLRTPLPPVPATPEVLPVARGGRRNRR